MTTIMRTLTLSVVQCANCGTVFGLDEFYEKKKRESHDTFYCPNGHAQHFPAKSEAEKLRDQLKAERDHNAALRADRDQIQASLKATKGVVTRLRKRAIVGTCAFCHRHFANVERHVATEHPDEKP